MHGVEGTNILHYRLIVISDGYKKAIAGVGSADEIQRHLLAISNARQTFWGLKTISKKYL